jgi:hypothetical protein
MSASFAIITMVIIDILSFIAVAPKVLAQDLKTLEISPGESIDVYWEANLSGKIYVAADVAGSPACLDFWWILWPSTRIKNLGHQCGRMRFDLPSLTGDWAIGGKLRAGGAKARTRIQATSIETVAHNFPDIYF